MTQKDLDNLLKSLDCWTACCCILCFIVEQILLCPTKEIVKMCDEHRCLVFVLLFTFQMAYYHLHHVMNREDEALFWETTVTRVHVQ